MGDKGVTEQLLQELAGLRAYAAQLEAFHRKHGDEAVAAQFGTVVDKCGLLMDSLLEGEGDIDGRK